MSPGKTLKGIQVVYDSISKIFFYAPGLRTINFKRVYFMFNQQYKIKINTIIIVLGNIMYTSFNVLIFNFNIYIYIYIDR